MSCVSDNCPCKKRNNPCKRKCRCYNCKNVNNGNNSKDTGVKKPLFNKGCGCGLSKKSRGEHPIQESCRDGSRKSKCPCVAEGIGCTELCRCLNCANIVQPRVAPVTPIKQKKKKKRITFSVQEKRRKGVYGKSKCLYHFRDLEKPRNILFDSMPRGAAISRYFCGTK